MFELVFFSTPMIREDILTKLLGLDCDYFKSIKTLFLFPDNGGTKKRSVRENIHQEECYSEIILLCTRTVYAMPIPNTA